MHLARSLIVALSLMQASYAAAQNQPGSEPILRVETGMHTAAIPRGAVDAAGRLLVTASIDKTARLWSLETGDLIRIVRPPIGDGSEGMLYAVAISPDGKWLATAGWTGYQWDKSNSIYIFEADSGRMVRRLSGLPSVINHLAWSPDGRFLAAALGRSGGITIFSTEDWQEAARDTDYGSGSFAVVFDASGRLAAASYDGFLRLYDSQFQLVSKAKASGGRQPHMVAFSPDGSLLAVNYGDTNVIDVFSAPDLGKLYSVDAQGLANSVLFYGLTWTSDGTLLAGGTYQHPDLKKIILRAPEDGRGPGQTTDVGASNSILSLIPLPDRGFIYTSADPAFGRYDPQQQRKLERLPDTADLRNQRDVIRLSPDALVIGFGLEQFGRRPVSFSLKDRRLEEGEARDDLAKAQTEGLAVTDWRDGLEPKLNGQRLPVNELDRSRSLAIAPDHQSFFLGSEFSFRRLDSSGKQVWGYSGPAPAWAVNISRDGRLAVAAFGDGTIRWYRYPDGHELLALFVHKDGKRWVLWTPQGYYDASPGAEDLIGWHVNRGSDQEADFFPASRFRDRFYKPEVVSAVLRTLDIQAALSQSGAKGAGPITAAALPPVIKILSPQEGAAATGSPVQVRYSVRSPSGERVTAIEIRVDGRPLPGGQGVVTLPNGPASPEAEQEGTLSVPIEKDATITLVARAGERSSEAANVRVNWKPSLASAAVAAAAAAVPKPKLYVLAVGISRYKDPSLQLRYAAKDATDVAEAWAAQQGGLYSQVVTRIVRDEQATREAVLDGLDWIERETTSRDVALVLLAGHGENDSAGAYYFLPYDVEFDKPLRRTAIPDVEIKRSLSNVAGKALFFFDTCHSGSLMGGLKAGQVRAGNAVDINGFVSELASAENGLVVFTASTGREFAQERDQWEHGAFSKALIEALSGRAELLPGQKVITISALEYWLAERVKTLTGGQQHPTTTKPQTIRDFPIAVAGAR